MTALALWFTLWLGVAVVVGLAVGRVIEAGAGEQVQEEAS